LSTKKLNIFNNVLNNVHIKQLNSSIYYTLEFKINEYNVLVSSSKIDDYYISINYCDFVLCNDYNHLFFFKKYNESQCIIEISNDLIIDDSNDTRFNLNLMYSTACVDFLVLFYNDLKYLIDLWK